MQKHILPYKKLKHTLTTCLCNRYKTTDAVPVMKLEGRFYLNILLHIKKICFYNNTIKITEQHASPGIFWE